MLIKDNSKPIWMHCKSCGNSFRMGSSCGCGGVQTKELKEGAYLVVGDSDDVVYDTE